MKIENENETAYLERRTDGSLRHFGSDHQLRTKSRRFIDLNIVRPKPLYVEMVVNPCLYTASVEMKMMI